MVSVFGAVNLATEPLFVPGFELGALKAVLRSVEGACGRVTGLEVYSDNFDSISVFVVDCVPAVVGFTLSFFVAVKLIRFLLVERR